MPQSRGLVKITLADPGGNMINDIQSLIYDAVSIYSDTLPFNTSFWNWIEGTSNIVGNQQYTNWLQSMLTEIGSGGYIFYAEDCQIVYHGKSSETFPVANGGNTTTETNSQSYREIKLKVFIGPRDVDTNFYGSQTVQDVRYSFSGGLSEFLQGGIDLLGAAISQGVTALEGQRAQNIINYLNKRANFLMDLDGKDIWITSTLFPAINGSQSVRARVNTLTMTTPSGQEETQYELDIIELVQQSSTNPTDNTNNVNSGEPGTAALPPGG